MTDENDILKANVLRFLQIILGLFLGIDIFVILQNI